MTRSELLDARRNIRKELVAFISIVMIGLLAALAYLGIAYSAAALKQDALLYSLNHIDPPVPEEEYDLSLDENARIPYFADPRVQFQLMTCTAGNAMFIARTGALAQKIIRKVSRYYLDHGRMLDVAAAAVERTDDLDQDLSRMYRTAPTILSWRPRSSA